ncbi:GNAT family acetyltransferase [Alloalcanivorax xenomutans]|uniref:GNAT family acetyltransferase n=1 Tax=Alloalcanivorax xenomutans TaxID=1094342 RepID=UPI003D9B0976
MFPLSWSLVRKSTEIRSFRESDRESMIALWEECGLPRPWNDPNSDISRKLQVQPELFFVGEVGGKVMASVMAGYDGHCGSVFYLAVSPEHQRRGFGKPLMRKIEEALTAMGYPKLNIVVRSSSDQVLASYERLGYAIDDVVSMGKRLIPDS